MGNFNNRLGKEEVPPVPDAQWDDFAMPADSSPLQAHEIYDPLQPDLFSNHPTGTRESIFRLFSRYKKTFGIIAITLATWKSCNTHVENQKLHNNNKELSGLVIEGKEMNRALEKQVNESDKQRDLYEELLNRAYGWNDDLLEKNANLEDENKILLKQVGAEK